MKSVWIYVDTRRGIGDFDHLKVFSGQAAAEARFVENEPAGLAFEYDVVNHTSALTPR